MQSSATLLSLLQSTALKLAKEPDTFCQHISSVSLCSEYSPSQGAVGVVGTSILYSLEVLSLVAGEWVHAMLVLCGWLVLLHMPRRELVILCKAW